MNSAKIRKEYSLVLHPSIEIIDKVAALKAKLTTKIRKYASRDSVAHVTIIKFLASQKELMIIEKKIEMFCNSQKQQKVIFNRLISSKKSRTIFVIPDESSKTYLKNLLDDFRKRLKTRYTKSGGEAHISIGRKLSSTQIDLAQNLFGPVTLKFNCDTVALRKFSETKKQFEVIKTFKFLENPLIDAQYSLFD